jgi:energy-coupling factor transporter transmembrane protein EcfT
MTQLIVLIVALFSAFLVALGFYFRSAVIKVIAILFLFILANLVYFAFDGVKGWPAEEKDNVKGTLASVVIINPTNNEEGAIYISLFPSTPYSWWEYNYPRIAPKTYYVKYTNDRASKFEEAKQAMEEGKEVRINGIPPEESPEGEEGNSESMEGGIIGSINGLLKKLAPKQQDTYTPDDAPDIQIVTPDFPRKE